MLWISSLTLIVATSWFSTKPCETLHVMHKSLSPVWLFRGDQKPNMPVTVHLMRLHCLQLTPIAVKWQITYWTPGNFAFVGCSTQLWAWTQAQTLYASSTSAGLAWLHKGPAPSLTQSTPFRVPAHLLCPKAADSWHQAWDDFHSSRVIQPEGWGSTGMAILPSSSTTEATSSSSA